MSIEERAKKASEGYDDDGYSAGLYMGYIEGATEQKVIDIDKACKWLKEMLSKCCCYVCHNRHCETPIEARPKGKGWKWIAEEMCWVRLRKLTPKECFRLMDVSEEGIDKIQTAIFPDKKSVIPIGYGVPDAESKQTRISDSQQYKMAGNSIVVACLSGIFENLFTQEEVIKETLF